MKTRREEPLRIALMGTRGVPARYGGFETAAEEIGRRLVARGHDVVVFCRNGNGSADGSPVDPKTYLGMRLVHLPALRSRFAETLSHSALSVMSRTAGSCDVAIMFNAANAPLLPVLRARRIPVAVHVDGLEWKRSKWSETGKRYYLRSERLAVRWADELIADAEGISDYYRATYGASTRFIPYGAPILGDALDRLAEMDLEPNGYQLVVARFEPENHVHTIVAGYRQAGTELPLVVVGSSPYNDEYAERVRAAAGGDRRIRLVGGVYDQALLDQLYAGSLQYLHGHSVGGTNPSLLRAMGGGAAVAATDVSFNREVLGDTGVFFEDEGGVAAAVDRASRDRAEAMARGRRSQARVRAKYDWEAVTDGYEEMCRDLAVGYSRLRTPSRTDAPTPVG